MPFDGPDEGRIAAGGATAEPRAVFRPSPLIVFAAIALAFCATPVAFGAPLLWLVYLVPLGIVGWVLRTRTVVDTETVTVRTLLRRRTVAWAEVASLRLTKGDGVCAVLHDDSEIRLPSVNVRHLPELSVASGGRLEPRPEPSATAEHGDGEPPAEQPGG